MPLISNETSDKQLDFVAGVKQELRRQAKSMEDFINRLTDAVWQDGVTRIQLPDGTFYSFKSGLTPEEKLAALGTTAKDLFSIAAYFKSGLIMADPTAAERIKGVPDAYATRLTFGDDGRVTVAPAPQS